MGIAPASIGYVGDSIMERRMKRNGNMAREFVVALVPFLWGFLRTGDRELNDQFCVFI